MSKGAARLSVVKRDAHERPFRLAVGDGFELRPVVTDAEHLDGAEVLSLTEWRNRHVTAFLHEFTATEARTGGWLAKAVGPDDTRILFMLRDEVGELVGYLGLAYIDWAKSYGEADAIVRGRALPPGTMKRALKRLLAWAQEELGLGELGVRVLSDNPACEFYRKCGFREIRREPLAARTVGDGRIWQPATSADGEPSRWLVHFRYDAV